MNNRLITCILLFFCFFVGCNRSNPKETDTGDGSVISLSYLSKTKIDVPEPSGLFFNRKTNTLFSISDQTGKVYELGLDGTVIKSVSLYMTDMEGVSFTRNCDTMVVVEEGKKAVNRFDLNFNHLSSFVLGYSSPINNGPEGITINPNNSHFFIVNEKEPRLFQELDNSGSVIQSKELTFADDLSDICYDSKLNCLWILSDESASVYKTDLTGTLIKQWKLPITNPEGIAVSEDDKMYIVSDSEGTFYVFTKPN
jgi:uncharacterized protein YjiK